MKRIKSLLFKGSSFIEENFIISFSQKLKCLLGGHGTGKSTLIYFIQAALDKQAVEDLNFSNITKANR